MSNSYYVSYIKYDNENKFKFVTVSLNIKHFCIISHESWEDGLAINVDNYGIEIFDIYELSHLRYISRFMVIK